MSTCIILLKIKWFSHHRYPTLFSKRILRLKDCLNAHHGLEQVSNGKSYSVKYIICLMAFTFAILLSCNFFWLSLMHTNILNIPWKTVFFSWVKIESFINGFGLQYLFSKYHVESKFYIQGCLMSLC